MHRRRNDDKIGVFASRPFITRDRASHTRAVVVSRRVTAQLECCSAPCCFIPMKKERKKGNRRKEREETHRNLDYSKSAQFLRMKLSGEEISRPISKQIEWGITFDGKFLGEISSIAHSTVLEKCDHYGSR